MLPEDGIHPSRLSEPFVKTLVGEASHLSAYDVIDRVSLLTGRNANIVQALETTEREARLTQVSS